MDAITAARRARAFKRHRSNPNPICRLCGKSDQRCRYEQHHIAARFAGRRLCDATVLLCIDCHDKASDMQRDFLSINPKLNTQIALRINRAVGQAILLELLAEQRRQDAAEILALANLELASGEKGQ